MNKPSDEFAGDLLRQLVAIPSVSGQEQRAVDFLIDAMRGLGFTRAYRDDAGNAVGVRAGSGQTDVSRRTLILLGHIDTVPGLVPVRIEEGRLYGRGTVDAKGPLATFVMAAARAQIPDDWDIVVIGAVEEESASSKGARHVAQDWKPPAMCIIGEPSGWDGITLGYKGRILCRYEAELPEGHTAGPAGSASDGLFQWWRGVIDYCQAFNRDRPRLFDQLLPTVRRVHSESDGLIDRVQASASIRLPPDVDLVTLKRVLVQSAAPATATTSAFEPAFAGDRQNRWVASLASAIRQKGGSPTYKLKTGTSDLNVVGPAWKCPIAAYGPGDSVLDHTPNEHVVLSEYLLAISVLQTLIESA